MTPYTPRSESTSGTSSLFVRTRPGSDAEAPRSPLADRRVVVRQLPDSLRSQLVQAAVADVPDRQGTVRDDGQRDHACHVAKLWRFLRASENLVVRDGNRLANPFGRGAKRTAKTLQDDVAGERGRHLAGGMTAHAVDDSVHTTV